MIGYWLGFRAHRFSMKRVKSLASWFHRNGQFFKRHRYTEPPFKPYALAIGQVLLAWNDLHERLSTLFAESLGPTHFFAFTIWHSIRSDYSKRQVMRAMINELTKAHTKERPKLVEEVIWILNCCDELEGKRDDAAHTPLYHYEYGLLNSPNILAEPNILHVGIGVQANYSFENPRARRFIRQNRDVLVEHKHTRERICILRDYVIAIDYAWMNAHVPWPDRPRLPDRKPNRRSKGRAVSRKQK